MTKQGYFPILDVIRLFASLGVLVTHSATFFNDVSSSKINFTGIITNAGYFGVIFFYVLSGFLITYLLRLEKNTTGTIAIRKFYIRRSLRIWPLYYFLIFLAFFILPFFSPWHMQFHHPDKMSLIFYLLFLPNVVPLFQQIFYPLCFHTYTIGYEEQFYLFWPLIMKKTGKYAITFFIILFLCPIILQVFHGWLISNSSNKKDFFYFLRGILTFIQYSNVQAFIAGGIAAQIFIYYSNRIKAIANRWVTILLVLIIIYLMYIGPSSTALYVNMVALIFASLIINIVQLKFLDNKLFYVLTKLGKASYSIYIFHPAILLLVSFLLSKGFLKNFNNSIFEYCGYLLISIILTLIVSMISYTYFESVFLKKKSKFEPQMLKQSTI